MNTIGVTFLKSAGVLAGLKNSPQLRVTFTSVTSHPNNPCLLVLITASSIAFWKDFGNDPTETLEIYLRPSPLPAGSISKPTVAQNGFKSSCICIIDAPKPLGVSL